MVCTHRAVLAILRVSNFRRFFSSRFVQILLFVLKPPRRSFVTENGELPRDRQLVRATRRNRFAVRDGFFCFGRFKCH